MLDTLIGQIGAIVWLAVCAFAILKGDQLEKIGAGALIVCWLGTLAVNREVNFTDVNWPVMAIDIVLFLVLLGLAWKSDRSWPLWASAFQMITVLVHIVTAMDLRIRAIAYISAFTVSSYGLLACLAIGTFWAWQEREALKPRE